jgi:hypothetical protein
LIYINLLSDISVVITVIAMLMMQMIVNDVINVVSVGNGLMPTGFTVNMIRSVLVTIVGTGAAIWIFRANRDPALIDMVLVVAVQMSIMEVICVISVQDRLMTAVGAVSVRMLLVAIALFLVHHSPSFFASSTRESSSKSMLDNNSCWACW